MKTLELVTMFLYQVGILPTHNDSRKEQKLFSDNDDRGNMAVNMARGWLDDGGFAKVHTVEHNDVLYGWDKGETVKRIVAERERVLAELKNSDQSWSCNVSSVRALEMGLPEKDIKTDISGNTVYSTYQRLFFDVVDGQAIPKVPTHILNTCYRRLSTVPAAIALCEQIGAKNEFLEGMEFRLAEYVDNDDRSNANVRENRMKQENLLEMSNATILSLSCDYVERLYNETKLRDIMGWSLKERGQSQKYHRLGQLFAKFPECEFLSYVMAMPDREQKIRKYHKETVYDLLKGEKIGNSTDRTGKLATAKQVKDYLDDPSTGNAKPSIASKTQIATFVENTTIEAFRLVGQAILDNELNALSERYNPAKVDIAKAWKSATEKIAKSE